MQPSQAISLVLGRLGDIQSNAKFVQIAIQELNAAQEQFTVGPHIPWFVRKVTNPVLSVGTGSTFEVPADFLTFVEETPVTYTSDNGSEIDLDFRTYDELEAKFPANGSITGSPKYYCLVSATEYKLYPVVTSGTVRFTYNSQQALVNSAGEIDVGEVNHWYRWAPFLLINKAVYEIEMKYLKNQEQATAIKPDIGDSLTQLVALSTMQEITNRTLDAQPIRRR